MSDLQTRIETLSQVCKRLKQYLKSTGTNLSNNSGQQLDDDALRLLETIAQEFPWIVQALNSNRTTITELASNELGVDELILMLEFIESTVATKSFEYSNEQLEQIHRTSGMICELLELNLLDEGAHLHDIIDAYGDIVLSQLSSLVLEQTSPTGSRVKLLCLNLFIRPLEQPQSHPTLSVLLRLFSRREWCTAIARCLESDDIAVAEHVSRLIQLIDGSDELRSIITESPLPCELVLLFNHSNSVVQTRIVSCLAGCSGCWRSDKDCFIARYKDPILIAVKRWLLDSVDDVLMQVTAVELLNHYVSHQEAVDFLLSEGIIQIVIDIISFANNDNVVDSPSALVYADLLASQCFVFLGKFAYAHFKEFWRLESSSSFSLVKYADIGLDSADPQLQEAAVTCIGQVLSSPSGNQQHADLTCSSCPIELVDSEYPHLLSRIARKFHSTSNTVRLAYMRAIASILATPVSSITTNQSLLLKLLNPLVPSSLKIFFKSAQHTFPDHKMCGYAVLRGIANHVVGCGHLLNEDVFISQFLLNRTAESTHEGHVAKYELVKQIVDTVTSASAISNDISAISFSTHQADQLSRCQEYVRQGVYYSRGISTVAMGV